MKRIAVLALFGALAACSDSMPLDSESPVARPALALSDGSGGLSFTPESACQYYASEDDFECNYTIEGLNPTHTYQLQVSAYWAYHYECVHQKSGKPDRNGVQILREPVQDVHIVTGVSSYSANELMNGPAPQRYDPCANNQNAYTVIRILSGPEPAGTFLFIFDHADGGNTWARLEDLWPIT